MPSATMQALLDRKKKSLEAYRNSEAENQPEESIDTEVDDDNQPDEVDEQPDGEEQEAIPENQPVEDNTDAQDDNADEEPPEEDSFKRKFERLSGKTSGLEKRANQAEADKADLQKQLDEANARLAARKEIESLRPKPKPDTADAPSDEWGFDGYDDEEAADTPEAKPKRKAATAKGLGEEDVDARVNAALAERDKQRAEAQFVSQMDKVLADLGDESTFVELINEPDFDAFVSTKRARLAVFTDAVSHKDAESIANLRDMVGEYLGRDKAAAPKGKKSPPVQKQKQAMPKSKGKQITEQQYQKALKDMRHASRRKAANKIIDAYKKQQKE